jgi:hypothetical protein
MTAAAAKPTDNVQTFRSRCAAATRGWLAGKLDLHAAVDPLAASAAERGIDIDVAQRLMADAFKPHRRPGDGGLP